MKRKLKIEISLAVLLLIVALFGSFLAPYDPLKVNYDLSLQPPSLLHIFGTDKLGRDVLSRILCGAKTSFGLTFLLLFLIVSNLFFHFSFNCKCNKIYYSRNYYYHRTCWYIIVI